MTGIDRTLINDPSLDMCSFVVTLIFFFDIYSGKTCVFLVPILEKIKVHDPHAGVRAIILSPTR